MNSGRLDLYRSLKSKVCGDRVFVFGDGDDVE